MPDMDASKNYDVIAVGAGAAGVSAAVQASGAGARTLLVEKTGMCGGTTTSGGVNYPGLFHAWGKQIIAGIGWDIVRRTVEETGGVLPDFADYHRPHHMLQIRVNRFVYAALCDRALTEAGVDVLFHTMVAKATPAPDDDGWHVTLCTKQGLIDHHTQVVIDCTGDANVAALAKLPVRIREQHQPATLSCNATGYAYDKLDIDAINLAFDREVKAGRMKYTDVSWNTGAANVGGWLRSGGANANHTHGINARTSEGRSKLELASREQLLRVFRFLRTQPGLENLVIDQVSPECGVRETAVIQGKKTVTVDDYQSGRVWDDAVCYSFYPIDLHTSDGKGLKCEPLAEGVVPTIPRGAMLPVGSSNFIVAGRCISSDRLANSALRVQATCMATGQAAGVMAALGAELGIDPEHLPISQVLDMLNEHGAITDW
jgi:hypothetical protein